MAGSATFGVGNAQTVRLQNRLPGVVRATLVGMFVSFQVLTIGASNSASNTGSWELCMRMFFVSLGVVAASTGFVSIYAPVVMIAALRTFLDIDIGHAVWSKENLQLRKRVRRNIAKLRVAGSVNFVFFAALLIASVVVLLSPAALFRARYGLPIFSHSAAFLIGVNSLMFYFGGVRHRTRRTTIELGRRDSIAGRNAGRAIMSSTQSAHRISDARTRRSGLSGAGACTNSISGAPAHSTSAASGASPVNSISGASVLGPEPGPEVLYERSSATVVPTSPA